MAKREIVLINITGEDKPGLTSSLTAILAEYKVNVLDIGQSVIHDHLSLGILVELPHDVGSSPVLKDLLFKAYELKVGVKFTPIEEEIRNKHFERKEIGNVQLAQKYQETKDIFKDHYLLHFLNLKDEFIEQDLENAILHDLEKFIMELGKGFTFVERQKRMIIDGDDYRLDLLFFHRKLKRLVAIELKIDKFRASYKGQMELYLKWLNKHERQEGEERLFKMLKKYGFKTAILQKFSNYRVRLVIIGDFSTYTSKSLNDFIRESNKGKQVNFLNSQSEALEALAN